MNAERTTTELDLSHSGLPEQGIRVIEWSEPGTWVTE